MSTPSRPFSHFAIAGPGDSSEYLINTILHYRASFNPSITLRLLTRTTSKPKPQQKAWEEAGATIHPVLDVSSEVVRDALEGVDVLYSNIGIYSPFDQISVANAAREAGVQIFFPFEYGADAENYDGAGVYKTKVAFRRWLEESGWSGRWIGYHTGWYTEPVIGEFIGFDVLEPGKSAHVKIWGDGDALFSTTSRVSLGEFLGHILTHQPRTRLLALASKSPSKNNRLRLEASRTNFNNLLALIRSLYKGDISVDRSISTKELVQMAKAAPNDFVLDMLATYAEGYGVVGETEGGNWKQWVADWEWQPRSLKDMIREKLIAANRLT